MSETDEQRRREGAEAASLPAGGPPVPAERHAEAGGPQVIEPPIVGTTGNDPAVVPPMGSNKVTITRSFILHRDDGTRFFFDHTKTNFDEGDPGDYMMDDSDANHWFVLANSSNPPDPIIPPQPGTAAYIDAEQRRQAQLAHVEAVEDQAEKHVVEQHRQQRTHRIRRALGQGGDFEPSPPA